MHIDYKEQNNIRVNSDKKGKYKIFKNYEIFQGKIRLIEDGKSPIIIERDKAIENAKNLGMDLVQIAYNKNDFPHSICKILNYSKHVYEQQKKDKLAKKIARANEVEIKEVCFSIRCDTHDREIKCKHCIEFLQKKFKVKIIVKLLRREMHLKDMATDMMKSILSTLNDYAELDSPPSATGNILSCIVKSKKD